MATEVEICNAALAKLRARRITSLSDDSLEGRTCKDTYFISRDALLASQPWNFATRRAQVAQIAGLVPAFQYTRAYQLPGDCLGVFDSNIPNEVDWIIESGQLLTNYTDVIAVRYAWRNTDTSSYQPAFQEVLAYKMAAEMAYTITQNATLAANMQTLWKEKMREARSYSAQQRGSQQAPEASSWLDSRY